MELFQENVIITANIFNVMLVSAIWLDRHGIIREDEMTPGGEVDPNCWTVFRLG